MLTKWKTHLELHMDFHYGDPNIFSLLYYSYGTKHFFVFTILRPKHVFPMGIQTNFYKFSTFSPKHAIHIFPIWSPCIFFNKGLKHTFYDQCPKHVFYTVSIKRLKQKYVFPTFPYRNPNKFLYISIWSPKYVFHIFPYGASNLTCFLCIFHMGSHILSIYMYM